MAHVQLGKKAFVSSFLILLLLMALAGTMTRIVPTGHFHREKTEGREVVQWNSFSYTSCERLPVWRWFTAPIEVLWGPEAPSILILAFLILSVGGAFSVFGEAKLMEYMMAQTVRKFQDRKYILLSILTLLFMFFGAFLGIFEEMIPLIPLALSLSFMMGWDSLVGLGFSLLAAGLGFSAALANPFTIGLAQKLAQLPPFSGAVYRMVFFSVIYGMLVTFLLRYARKIERNPVDSLVYEEDREKRRRFCLERYQNMPGEGPIASVSWFCVFLGLMVFVIAWGIVFPQWADFTLPSIAFIYTASGIVCGKTSRMGTKSIAISFWKGMAGIFPAVILILMGGSVKHIIVEGQIMDTMIRSSVEMTSGQSPYAMVIFLYLLVMGGNFFISSASAKAFLLIPLLLPFAEMAGLTRQATVTAWAFGDGFSNVLYPTNVSLLISLGLAEVSYLKWVRWTIALHLAIMTIAIAFLLLAVRIGYGPY